MSFRTVIKQVEFSPLPSAYCLNFSYLNRQTSKNVIFLNDFNIIQRVPCTNNVTRLLGKVQLFIANKHRSTHCNIQSMKSVGKSKWIQEACLSRGTSLLASRLNAALAASQPSNQLAVEVTDTFIAEYR